MYPTLRDGDEIWVDLDAYTTTTPAPGDVVLARHPYQRDVEILKRVTRVHPDGSIEVRGDEPIESTDSRSFGPLRPDAILGRVEVP